MIADNVFLQLATECRKALAEGRLHDVLYMMDTLTAAIDDIRLKEKKEGISMDYQRLLDFMRSGGDDPSREQVYNKLLQSATTLLQDIRRTFRLQKNKDAYTATRERYPIRWEEGVCEALKAVKSRKKHTEADDRFNLLWTSPQFTSEAKKHLTLILEESSEHEQQYLLSALTIALLEYFDPQKLQILLDYTTSEHIRARAVAVVGACICSQLYASYIKLYPSLLHGFQQISTPEIAYVQHDFCLYLDTERLQQKMQNEILPELIRAKKQREKLGFEESDVIDINDHDNGMDRKTKKRITDGMQEMAQLAMEGMDLNLGTFANLKKFPFFHDLCHWLAPFDEHRPEAKNQAVLRETNLCDSDKYSLAILLNSMPKDQAKAMQENLNEQINGMPALPNNGNVIRQYHNAIQSLYRCLKLSPWSKTWPVVFSPKMIFINNEVFQERLSQDEDFLTEVGNTFFRHEHYAEAEKHLQPLLQLQGGSATVYTQLGQCLEEQGKLSGAVSHYRNALLLQPDDEDTLIHLQRCLGQMGQSQAQLDCLLNLEQKHPEDERILTETGLCLMQLQRWEEAQKRFYHLEFNDLRPIPSCRAIAWCSLQMKKWDTAYKYYQRIFTEYPQYTRWEDYLNCGHTEWFRGNKADALKWYHNYVKKYILATPNVKDALRPFDQDRNTLLRLGLPAYEIRLMHDLIVSML